MYGSCIRVNSLTALHPSGIQNYSEDPASLAAFLACHPLQLLQDRLIPVKDDFFFIYSQLCASHIGYGNEMKLAFRVSAPRVTAVLECCSASVI